MQVIIRKVIANAIHTTAFTQGNVTFPLMEKMTVHIVLKMKSVSRSRSYQEYFDQ